MAQHPTNSEKTSNMPLEPDVNGGSDEVEKLRSILLQPERDEIKQLQDQIAALQFRLGDAQTRAAETSEILVEATKLTHEQDEEFSPALGPIVVEQFKASAANDTEQMAEALFPILGPAIRKMIASMLSPDKNKSKRTYKFEQLFLIEKESGLPICHAKSDAVEAQDADMVSGMLSAIQSFVHDAFSTQEFDGLNTLQLGDVSVWIEWGPSAVVAAVIRGVAPEQCRTALQQLLEDIHKDYSVELDAYEGDSAPFDKIKTDFLHFIDNHDSRLINRVRIIPRKIRNIGLIALIVACALFIWIIYNQYDKNRWNNFVSQLDAQAGIVVTSSERKDGLYIVRGLQDPLANSPSQLLNATNIDAEKVSFELEPYRALNAQFTLERVRSVLLPSNNVTLELNGSELIISGASSKGWMTDTKRLVRQFAEISHVTFRP